MFEDLIQTSLRKKNGEELREKLQHYRVFAPANGLVDMILIHGCWIDLSRVSTLEQE